MEISELIISRIDRLDTKIECVRDTQVQIQKDIVGLKIKASIWGAVAGGISALGAVLVTILKS